MDIKVIIGLGNPGKNYYYTRHSIGFRIVDALAACHQASWHNGDLMEKASCQLGDKKVILVKPNTFMNASGAVVPLLTKQGIKPENILVVHDELEKPFGALTIKIGGSHRGHNGLRSIMHYSGPDFARLRFGIGRPQDKTDVADYVLHNFQEPETKVEEAIAQAVAMIEKLCAVQS